MHPSRGCTDGRRNNFLRAGLPEFPRRICEDQVEATGISHGLRRIAGD